MNVSAVQKPSASALRVEAIASSREASQPSSAAEDRETVRRRYSERVDLPGIDPTRFGDWEYAGRCTDF